MIYIENWWPSDCGEKMECAIGINPKRGTPVLIQWDFPVSIPPCMCDSRDWEQWSNDGDYGEELRGWVEGELHAAGHFPWHLKVVDSLRAYLNRRQLCAEAGA